MGQRLKDLDFGPYVTGSLAGHRSIVDAAQAQAAGSEALGRGIAQGMASITAKALRKHQESREDARYAVQDENMRADNARADAQVQFQVDQTNDSHLERQKAGLVEQLRNVSPMSVRGVQVSAGDPQAAQDILKKLKKIEDAQGVIWPRKASYQNMAQSKDTRDCET